MSKITLLLIGLLAFNTIRYSSYLMQGSDSLYYMIMLGLNIVGLIIAAGDTYLRSRRVT
ncbi:hypothetical protein JMA_10140 [Jeotgalibacillus malaysiensis]|uniref:Uncharacterized protein n=1 Tax=Jeotgalibacillus malaysiensis TaxID=1508404 RepID=A0A0B5AJY8_9BACL|nr:hypothetical protein [Jeotgalibacillus malaysiensis]AJD90331.1 hypothetical protein JMA_10140 [Jeotgalibacillus malaysiensis]